MAGITRPIPGVTYPAESGAEGSFAEHLPNATLVSAFREIVRQYPTRTALASPDGILSFADLDLQSTDIAAKLVAVGLRPQDRVIFQLRNSPALVVMLLACLKAHLIPVCTLYAHREEEIGQIAAKSKARAHLIHADEGPFDFRDFAKRMQRQTPTLQHIISMASGAGVTVSEAVQIEQFDGGNPGSVARPPDIYEPEQVALFQISGGTSGVPKIIPRFNNEYLFQIQSMAGLHGLGPESVGFCLAPMIHNAPMLCYWGPVLWSGGMVICGSSSEPAKITALIRRFSPTWMALPLPVAVRLHLHGVLDQTLFKQTTLIAATGISELQQMTGATVLPLYGMTEGINVCAIRSDPQEILTDSVGRPVLRQDRFKIIDPASEEELPGGQIGEFCFKGPSSIRGYFGDPEQNLGLLTIDGYVKSGDLMRVKQIKGQQVLSFEGRIKDVVNRAGETISCAEVERILSGHPAVRAVAIVPMPDPVYGEKACAFVIGKTGHPTVNVHVFAEFLKKIGLAKFKWPERVELIDTFPLGSAGKLSKVLLRDEIAQRQRDSLDG